MYSSSSPTTYGYILKNTPGAEANFVEMNQFRYLLYKTSLYSPNTGVLVATADLPKIVTTSSADAATPSIEAVTAKTSNSQPVQGNIFTACAIIMSVVAARHFVNFF